MGKADLEKIYTAVDWEKYASREKIALTVEGWIASVDSRPIEIQVLAEGEPIPFEKQRKLRLDVVENVEELRGASPEVGFSVIIPEVDDLWEHYGEFGVFQILAVRGEEKQVVWEKTGGQMNKDYGAQTMKYKLDVVQPREGRILLQGWVVDDMREEKISVVDEKKNPIPFEMERVMRLDVMKAQNLKDGYAYGFEIAIMADQVPGDWLVLILENRLTQKKCRVNLKKMYYRHSRRGRLARALRRERMAVNRAYIRQYGVGKFIQELGREMDPDASEDHGWLKKHGVTRQELKLQRQHEFPYQPMISIVVPLYNTPLKFLKAMVESIQKQSYPNWELCLADGSTDDQAGEMIRKNYGKDVRIRYRRLPVNRGISGNTNAALDMARGEFIMLCDHDDVVTPDACYEMVKALNTDEQVDIVYSDEDKLSMDGLRLYDPHFKPDFNLDLLRSNNYICHIFMVRKAVVDRAGKFRSEFDGAQDYDFILRCCEQARKIYHVPRSLYHWRSHPASTAGNPSSKMYAYKAGEEAVRAHYNRLGMEAEVSMTEHYGRYRTTFPVKGNPKVSILIPNKDHREDLERAIASIYEKSTYSNFEVLVIENNSTQEETFACYQKLQEKHSNLGVVAWKGEFNYAAINNYGAGCANGEYLLFLNNDIEIISPDWMEEMLGYCQREDVGVCGVKLLYPNNRIQHAGVVVGLGGPAGHVLCGAKNGVLTYAGKSNSTQDLSAVTAACMMTPKEIFDKAGGFGEEFQVAYNDVDYCLKVRQMGLLVVYNAFVEAYHYESATRGAEDTPEKKKRLKREAALFAGKWPEILEKGDPYYNVNLTLDNGDCRLRGQAEALPKIEDVQQELEQAEKKAGRKQRRAV